MLVTTAARSMRLRWRRGGRLSWLTSFTLISHSDDRA
jgi:hypothetical protein